MKRRLLWVLVLFLSFGVLACNKTTTDVTNTTPTTIESTKTKTTTVQSTLPSTNASTLTTIHPTTTPLTTSVFTTTELLTEVPIADKETHYDMEVYLDTRKNEMSVTGTIIWYNYVGDIDTIYLNVYANASNMEKPSNDVVINQLSIDGYDITYAFDMDVPTALRIDSSTIFGEGDFVKIHYDIKFSLWDSGRLYGDENYVNALFFYPYVAKYTDTWNIEPYSFIGETYFNDIGNYDVTINVPSDFLIATGGQKESTEIIGGRRIEHYSLQDARDFSFSTSRYYTVYMETVNGIDYSIYSVSELSKEDMISTFQYLAQSFEVFGNGIGEYPYDHFTLEYGFLYGMESSGIAYVTHDIIEEVVIHEVGHQWFFNMIGNDQYNESFLDEALVTFIVAYYYDSLYGIQGYNGYLESRNSLSQGFSPYFEASLGVDLRSDVDTLGDNYAFAIYYHGPTLFKIFISEYMNNDYMAFLDILKIYFNEYDGKIATIDDFLYLLKRETGVPNTITWFNDQLESMQNPLI